MEGSDPLTHDQTQRVMDLVLTCLCAVSHFDTTITTTTSSNKE